LKETSKFELFAKGKNASVERSTYEFFSRDGSFQMTCRRA